jgi:tape measure domain-containing protein
MKIAEAFVEIQGDKGKYSSTISKAKMETAGFARSATSSLKKISIGLAAVGAAAAVAAVAIGVKLTRAIINVGKATVSTAVKYDKLKIGLIAVTGSAAEAERQIKRLRVLAQDPGLGFEQALQGSVNLQAAGLSSELAERSLSAFGNALAVVGKGAQDLSGVSLALTQIANKTSGFGQDIRQLQERLPQMQTALRNAFDGKPVEDLEITGKELIAALVTEFEKLERAGESVGNNIVNLDTSFDLLRKAIGDKLVGATDRVVKSLTGIIDKLTVVVENYEDFRDEVARILVDVAIIGVRTTGAMMTSMGKIIAAGAKVIWEPLKTGLKIALLEVLETSIPGSNIVGVLKHFPKIGDDIEAAFNKAIKPIKDFTDKKQAEMWAASMDDAAGNIAEASKVIEAELKTMLATVIEGLSQSDKALGTLTDKIEKLNQLKSGLKSIADSFLSIFRSDSVFEFDKAVGKLNVSMANFSAFTKTFSQFKLEQFGPQLAQAFGNLGKVSQTAKDQMQAFWDAQREQTQRIVDTIAPAFENMFSDFFAGDTKVTWENFFKDLKRIAIRQLAQVFATQLLTGLLTGGASFGVMGLGSALSALAPRSIDPTSRAVGGAVRRGAGAVGSFLEGGTINVFDQDLGNFDQQRMTRQVQAIGPALGQAAADGI